MVTKAKKKARQDRIERGKESRPKPITGATERWTSVTTRLPSGSGSVLGVVHWEDDFYEVCQVHYFTEKVAEKSDRRGIRTAGWYEAVVDDYDYEFEPLRVTDWRPMPPLPARLKSITGGKEQ